MIKKMIIPLLLFPLMAEAVIDIDPTNPPEAVVLDNEQARLNLLTRRIDELVHNHAIIHEAERMLSEELTSEINVIVASYNIWQQKMFAIKSILADIDKLTSTQREQYQQSVRSVMYDLYDIRKESEDVRTRLNRVINDVELARTFPSSYIDGNDSSNDVGANVGFFTDFSQYRIDVLTALGTFKNIVDTDLERKMGEVIQITKDIVDELLLIRSLEFPELKSLLEELRQLTLEDMFIQHRHREVQVAKSNIADAINAKRPYFATALHNSLVERAAVLTDEINGSAFSTSFRNNAVFLISQEVDEAESYLGSEWSFPGLIWDRYNALSYAAGVCEDANDPDRFVYNCAVLKGIYGMNLEQVIGLEDDKLMYLEQQMDRVYAGVMGSE